MGSIVCLHQPAEDVCLQQLLLVYGPGSWHNRFVKCNCCHVLLAVTPRLSAACLPVSSCRACLLLTVPSGFLTQVTEHTTGAQMQNPLVATKSNVVTAIWINRKSLADTYMPWMVGSITTTVYILQMAATHHMGNADVCQRPALPLD